MVSNATQVFEDVISEIQATEPEIVQGGNTQITFPFQHNLRLSNFVRFYHPDGTHSDIAAPTYNAARPTPYRERFLAHYLRKRGPDGMRLFFLSPQAPEPELPIRCFVAPGGRQCTRRVSSLPDLYMHVMGRHGEESKLYADVLAAMKLKMQAQIDPETLRLLGLGQTSTEAKEGPATFYCRVDGCPRFFDLEKARDMHEKVQHKEGK
jgi:hypothetical protein